MEGQHAQQAHIETGVLVRRQRQVFAAMNGDLVIQLHVLRRDGVRQCLQRVAFRLVLGDRLRHGLHQRQLLQQDRQFAQRAFKADAALGQAVGLRHQLRAVAGRQRLQQSKQVTAVHRAQHRAHAVFLHVAQTVGDGLVQQRLRVAHGAGGRAAQQGKRRRFVGYAFHIQHMGQMAGHLLRRHIAQRELQTAAQHRHRHLLRVGGGQDEFDVGRRLLQRLQHRIEGALGQHVHFVDDVDLEAAGSRRVLSVFQHFADIVDAGVGRGVDLQQIDKAAGVDLTTGRAFAARLRGGAGFAIEALGQNPGDGGLAHPARPRQQISVMQTLFFEGVGQGAHHVLLADQIGKALGTPLTGKDLIAHGGGF